MLVFCGSYIELSVVNEGINFPEDKDRIFDLLVSLRDDDHRNSDSLGPQSLFGEIDR
ncbi:MAG: hypothetical protein V3V31_07775 [Methylococcales bacterium]